MTKDKIIERIAEIESWGSMIEPDEQEELNRLKRELYEIELVEQCPATLTIARLDRFEAERTSIRSQLRDLAIEIATFRGEKIPDSAQFESYERTEADDWAIKGYPKGTPMIRVTLRIPMRYEPDYVSVLFPESYLEEDWKPIEQAKLDAAKAKEVAEVRERARVREDLRRAEYERLRKIYGDQ